MNISLIFLAGGKGTRFGAGLPKQFLTLLGKPIALHSFEKLSKLPHLVEISLVCAHEFRGLFPQLPILKYALPGEERSLSVKNGLATLSEEETLVLIHDAARPHLIEKDMRNLLDAAEEIGAATLGRRVTQTIKQANEKGFVLQTIPRNALWEIHTPQCIKKSLLKEGFAYQSVMGHLVTDDVSLIEALGKEVKLVPSSAPNIKITHKEDLDVAKILMQL